MPGYPRWTHYRSQHTNGLLFRLFGKSAMLPVCEKLLIFSEVLILPQLSLNHQNHSTKPFNQWSLGFTHENIEIGDVWDENSFFGLNAFWCLFCCKTEIWYRVIVELNLQCFQTNIITGLKIWWLATDRVLQYLADCAVVKFEPRVVGEPEPNQVLLKSRVQETLLNFRLPHGAIE